MAWCPKCDGNYQIVVSVKGSSQGVPVISERYNWKDEYIGYETGEISETDIESLPRCSNCYSVFEFPKATSKEEFFSAKLDSIIKSWRARNPKPPEPGGGFIGCMGIIVGLLLGVIAYFIIKSPLFAAFIGLLAVVGLGKFGFWLDKPGDRRRREEYKNKILKRWEGKLYELQSMEYSDESYEKLMRGKKIEEVIKIPCTRCGAMILPTTAERTNGLCMPCAHGRR